MKEFVECEVVIFICKFSNIEFWEWLGLNGLEEFQVIEFGLSIFGEILGQLLCYGLMLMRIVEDGSFVGIFIFFCFVLVILRFWDRIDVESFVEDDVMCFFIEFQEF